MQTPKENNNNNNKYTCDGRMKRVDIASIYFLHSFFAILEGNNDKTARLYSQNKQGNSYFRIGYKEVS